MNAGNYAYDQEGRLSKDDQEQIDLIEWRVDGKVKKIHRPLNSGKNNVSFDYDAMGNRIAKHDYDDNWMLTKSTYYVLDASGNQMNIYEHVVSETEAQYNLIERNIYGSSRLGTFTEKVNMLEENTGKYTKRNP
jgi:YD repeat-containing protein